MTDPQQPPRNGSIGPDPRGSGRAPSNLFLGRLFITVLVCGFGLLGALGPAAWAKDAGYRMENSKIQAVVREVMGDQKDPRTGSTRLQALEEYEAYILKHFDYKSDLKAEAMHRLADLYMQLEINTHQKKIKEYQDRLSLYLIGGIQDRPPPPRIAHPKSIVIYEEILKQYPRRPANDAVLYQLARAYADEGRIDRAIHVLNRLVTEFPKSPLRQESYFRIGEFYFEILDYQKAILSYRESLQQPSEEFVEMALYKMGWSYFAQEQYRRSIDTFLSLLDRKTVPTETGQRRLQLYSFSELEGDLLKEVVRTLLLAFEELGGPEQLVAYFRDKGHRDYEDYLYRTLADIYVSQERFGEAVRTLQTFMKAYPAHEEAPVLQASIIGIQTQRKKVGLAVQAREDFVRTFGSGSPWSQEASDTARIKVAPLLRETSYELVLHYFAQAQRTKRPEDYEEALRWGERFLQEFPRVIEAAKVNFLLAEALYELKRYEAAATEYEKTAYGYPLHSHSQDAAYNHLLALEKNPRSTPEHRASAILKYSNRFPQDSRVPGLLLQAAQIAARQGDHTAAIEYAEKHLGSQSQAPNSYAARKLIATSYFEQKDYARAAKELTELLSSPGGSKGSEVPKQERQAVQTLLASSLYKQAEAEKAKGNLQQASKQFLAIHELLPGTEVAGIALLDGALMLMEQDQRKQAVSSLEELIRSYSRSEHAGQARVHLARLYEQEGRYTDALKQYEILSATDHTEEASGWLFHIASLSEKNQDWPRAYQSLSSALEKLPAEDERALDALYRAARALEQMGNSREARIHRSRVLERYAQVPAPTPRMAYVAAQANFDLGEQVFDEFMKVKLKDPLEENLEKKRQLLREALNYYSQAVDYKIPEYITASTFKVGILFEEFRNALLESERPTGLTSQQLEQYSFLLEEQAFPFEENAIAAHETNVRRVQEGGRYDQWVQQSYQRLAELLPARYDRDELNEIITKTPLF